ncbi:hypothetical protein GCM10027299_21460 [Larkinella ripae]
MTQLPTFTQYFDMLVAQKKQQIHKASDEDAFEAAARELEQRLGCRPDFGVDAYRKRKYSHKKK